MMKSLVELAVETAMRRGELLGLRWEHIDFSNLVAHLPVTKNGGRTLRTVVIARCSYFGRTTPKPVRLRVPDKATDCGGRIHEGE